MRNYLAELFKKRGITDATELDGEERATFDRWKRILSEGEVTVDKVTQFCEQQIDIIESKWRQHPGEENPKLIAYLVVYKAIKSIITGPKQEREALEKYLEQLIENS